MYLQQRDQAVVLEGSDHERAQRLAQAVVVAQADLDQSNELLARELGLRGAEPLAHLRDPAAQIAVTASRIRQGEQVGRDRGDRERRHRAIAAARERRRNRSASRARLAFAHL